jgi:hypothetical protein
MRPAFRYCAGWACAAVAATTVSWVAIRDVVATAAVGDPVPAQSVVEARGAAGDEGTPPTGRARISTPTATTVPSASLSPRGRRSETQPTGAGTAQPTRKPERSGYPDPPAGSPAPPATAVGEYQGYVLRGGQVVVQKSDSQASLVAAVPASGYETQTWKTDTWFRVDFVDGERVSSLIVAWNGHPPTASVTEF